MDIPRGVRQQLQVHRRFAVRFLSFLVGAHGLYILAVTLLDQIGAHHGSRINDLTIDLPLLIGLSLVYLSTHLRRQKRAAWLVTVWAYTFYLGLSVSELLRAISIHQADGQAVIRALVLPLAILLLLFMFQREFVVQSDVQGFRSALQFVAIILLITLLYGVAGFSLLDRSDFHQEISVPGAIHYTIDQFDLTTKMPLHAYTKRAHLFADSLSFVSISAAAYTAISLFQPLRMRLAAHTSDRERVAGLLRRYGGSSEEFFKLWPHDKHYLFDSTKESALAFHVSGGVALCLSDPVGNPKRFSALMTDFRDLCFGNNWLPAFVHVSAKNRKLFKKHGYGLQKLGEEAILELAHFQSDLASNKYFRQIRNKFVRQDYVCEILKPPHHKAVLDRLGVISKDWLSQGGRAERGFVMGYYSTSYLQSCQLMIARDAASTIQAFVNLVPADFDTQEATYDLLRQSSNSPGNITDFLLMNLITELSSQGYERLNLGLCPLVGLDDTDPDKKTLIDSALQFAYANGDRFYSFSGLHRFKAKYEPVWEDRYLAYQGGVVGFSRTITGLIRAMRLKRR